MGSPRPLRVWGQNLEIPVCVHRDFLETKTRRCVFFKTRSTESTSAHSNYHKNNNNNINNNNTTTTNNNNNNRMKTIVTIAVLVAAIFSGSADAGALRGGGARHLGQASQSTGKWECWMTNGVATETVSYGFSATDGKTATQTLKLAASATISQKISYGDPGILGGSTGIKLTGSIAHTAGSSVASSEMKSVTTTISARCPAKVCPPAGTPVNVCQWTVSGSEGAGNYKFASKSIMFAPGGKRPGCPLNAELPGTYCDLEHDNWCSRCSPFACGTAPQLPGCAWFAGATYSVFGSTLKPNKDTSSYGDHWFSDDVSKTWAGFRNGRWEFGHQNGPAVAYIDAPSQQLNKGEYPPEGQWRGMTSYKIKNIQYLDGSITEFTEDGRQPGAPWVNGLFVADTYIKATDGKHWIAHVGGGGITSGNNRASGQYPNSWIAGEGKNIYGHMAGAVAPNGWPVSGTWARNADWKDQTPATGTQVGAVAPSQGAYVY